MDRDAFVALKLLEVVASVAARPTSDRRFNVLLICSKLFCNTVDLNLGSTFLTKGRLKMPWNWRLPLVIGAGTLSLIVGNVAPLIVVPSS